MTTEKKLNIVRYTKEYKSQWDSFVANSRNGTFLLMRDYMEYHKERFNDHSLLFFYGKKIIALLPAHITDDALCSHCGLTYGGLILSDGATAALLLEIFEQLIVYIKEQLNATRLLYRPTPHIYHRYPCEEDLYALFRHNATLTERKISSAILLHEPLPLSQLRKRKKSLAQASGITIREEKSLDTFWQILCDNLQERHNTKPVHTIEEIKYLQSLFPDNIRLFVASDRSGATVGGALLYITNRVAHVQYIASTAEGREKGALDTLFDSLIRETFANKEYFDFGVSVEQGGHFLNNGLIFQKEGLGGRGICYDTYSVELKRDSND